MGLLSRFQKKQKEKDSDTASELLSGKKTIEEYLAGGSRGKASHRSGIKETFPAEESSQTQENIEVQLAYKVDSLEECNAYVEDTCKQIREATRRIQENKEEYDDVGNTLNDVLLMEAIDGQDRIDLTLAADRIVQANEERRRFQNTPRRIPDSQYQAFDEMKENIEKVLEGLEQDEKYARDLMNDMEKLEGEKASVHYEADSMQEKVKICQRLIQWIFVFLCTGIVFYIIILTVFQQRYDAFLYVVLGIIGISLAVAFAVYQNSARAFRRERQKLNKVIRLLNTAKLRYVNISNSISYRYTKYGVNSAYELNHLWNLYLEEKKQREIYRGSSKELHEAESELIGILSEYNLQTPRIWVNYAKAITDAKEMVEVRHELNVRRQKLRETMEYNKDILKKGENQIKRFAKLNPNYAADILLLVKRNRIV